MTIADELARAEAALAAAGVETARHDAEWIAAAALGERRSGVLAKLREPFPDGVAARFHDLIARRTNREPLAYVIGTVNFRGLELEVGPGVLVPRPETEITAERAIARARERGIRPTVVDVAAGCGAIALSLAAEVPDARIFATESSGAARGWALRNLARTGLRCTLLPGDLLRGLHPALGGNVDIIVSNPPYMPEDELGELQPEIRRYEPRDAVIAGPSGLEVILALLEQVPSWIAPGGWLVVELAPSQADRVSKLLQAIGYADVRVTDDLAGRARVVEGRWVHAG